MSAILVVDDEPAIRELLALSFEEAGFTVFAAGNGREALHIWHFHQDEIDLVLSDVVMPGMDGRTLAMKLLAERPGLPVLLTSGSCAELDLGSHETIHFLAKPFDLANLVGTVQMLVAQRSSVNAA